MFAIEILALNLFVVIRGTTLGCGAC